jgi:hypothetical protein
MLPIVDTSAPCQHFAVKTSHSLALSPEDHLDALRFLDRFRQWHSLDEKRLCTRCRATITGRQIIVIERNATRGFMRLQCPTPGCVSSPSEWLHPNPVPFAALPKQPSGFSRHSFRQVS